MLRTWARGVLPTWSRGFSWRAVGDGGDVVRKTRAKKGKLVMMGGGKGVRAMRFFHSGACLLGSIFFVPWSGLMLAVWVRGGAQ